MINEKRSQKQREIADIFDLKGRRGIILSSIRVGKTAAALLTIKTTEVLVCYPKLTIKDSWDREIERTQFVGDITFSSFASLKKLVAAGRKFKQIIVDESHKLSAKQWEYVKLLEANKDLLLLAGTMSIKKQKMWRERGVPVLLEYQLDNAIEDGLVKDYRLFIHYIDLENTKQDHQYRRFGEVLWGTEREVYNWYTAQMSYFDEKSKQDDLTESQTLSAVLGYRKYMGSRTNFIYNSVSLLEASKGLVEKYKDRRTLIFSLRTDVADELSENSFHSNNADPEVLQKFQDGVYEDGHLSTVGMVSEGVTFRNLNTIICHTVTANTEDFQQKLGRGLLQEETNEICQVHVLCLRNTQQAKWVEDACKSLSQAKISYIIGEKTISKIDWIKEQHPGKDLYLYNGSFCYFVGINNIGFSEYVFLGDVRRYSLHIDKLTKI